MGQYDLTRSVRRLYSGLCTLAYRRWIPIISLYTQPISCPKPLVQPHFTTTAFDVVALGASAGGFEALSTLLTHLPADFPAALVVAFHRSALAVHEACLGQRLQPGHVYLAPPGQHLVVNRAGTLVPLQAPKIRYMQPSVDLLFSSVAVAYQTRAIGVILSGMLDDGATGAYTLKHLGGRVLAQESASAQYPDMPSATIALGCVDFVLPLEHMAAALTTLVMVPGAATFFHVPLREPLPVLPREALI